MENYGKSVYLLENQCKGCTNCIKHCPTQAIRVRNGKAVITTDQCIDCGECIRICPHHAKKAKRGFIDAINNYQYSVALPAPSLYAQVNHLEDVNILLTALKDMGFDDVYEVSAAADGNNERDEVSLRPAQVPLQYRWPTFGSRTSALLLILSRRQSSE